MKKKIIRGIAAFALALACFVLIGALFIGAVLQESYSSYPLTAEEIAEGE